MGEMGRGGEKQTGIIASQKKVKPGVTGTEKKNFAKQKSRKRGCEAWRPSHSRKKYE